MHIPGYTRIRKIVILVSIILMTQPIFLAKSGPSIVNAQESEYFTRRTIILWNGTSLEETIIHGPPVPPPGYELQRTPVNLLQANSTLSTYSLTVPAFAWSFGCSATSGAMIAGYFDRNGFPNLYTGPTNGGLIPLDSSPWPDWTDGIGDTYAQCPLTASHNGLDGRTTRGSIDDYWVSYLGGFQDPYITNSWTQHSWGEAVGDYMKTSQSAYDNDDGSTSFYNYTSFASPLTCSAMEAAGISQLDGTYGRKLFYEARGYTVTDCYSQKTDNTIRGGFSFAQYEAEIDAGRPVMLNLAGHTIVGVGYEDATNTVYLHDTWDYAAHSMTWGGSYSGMGLESVSIVNIQTGTPTSTPTRTFTATSTPSKTNTPTFTPSKTKTPTFTPTQTNTATFTPSKTNTATFTPTRTNTASFTPSKTNTATSTRTSTSTASVTYAPTSTPTFTPTNTSSPSSTPTFTYTPTRTFTPSPTSTPTSTNTHTFAPSSTSTPTRTFTPSVTSTFTIDVHQS